MIQTFGTKDTVIEVYASDGALVAVNDDGGYKLNSLLNLYVSENTVYTVRVKFYSSSTYGEIKLAVAPAHGELSNGVAALDDYEDIYAAKNYTGFTWLAYAYPGQVSAITFTAPTSGVYSFTIESDFDTYIYVIDPRSTDGIVNNTHYNDNSGEGNNPLLTVELTAGIPYLIVYSAKNPGALAEIKNLTVQIYKE